MLWTPQKMVKMCLTGKQLKNGLGFIRWQLKVLKRAEKALEKLDRQKQIKIVSFLNDALQLAEPHKKAKAPTGKLVGLWRFSVGDFRIICQIDTKIIAVAAASNCRQLH